MKALNLALKFLLELAALAAFGLWGASITSGVVAVMLAIGLPVIVAILWGVFAAPGPGGVSRCACGHRSSWGCSPSLRWRSGRPNRRHGEQPSR